MHVIFADLVLVNTVIVYIVIFKMCLWITEWVSVVSDKNSEVNESLKDIEVEENDLVKMHTAENNVTIKKIKGKTLKNCFWKSVKSINNIIDSTKFQAHDEKLPKTNDKIGNLSKCSSKYLNEVDKLNNNTL